MVTRVCCNLIATVTIALTGCVTSPLRVGVYDRNAVMQDDGVRPAAVWPYEARGMGPTVADYEAWHRRWMWAQLSRPTAKQWRAALEQVARDVDVSMVVADDAHLPTDVVRVDVTGHVRAAIGRESR